MKHLRAFGLFWWDFVVGDDWRTAVGVLIAIAMTAGLVGAGVNAWWVMPIAVLVVLALSLKREAQKAS